MQTLLENGRGPAVQATLSPRAPTARTDPGPRPSWLGLCKMPPWGVSSLTVFLEHERAWTHPEGHAMFPGLLVSGRHRGTLLEWT